MNTDYLSKLLRAFRHKCKKLCFLLEDRNKNQNCIDVDFCIDAAIAVSFGIDEILKVLELPFAYDIDVNAAKETFLYYTI